MKVVGRRGKRRREASERKQKQRLERAKAREAERNGIEARSGHNELSDDEDDDLDDGRVSQNTPEARARKAQELAAIHGIVSGWEDTGRVIVRRRASSE